jgi:hypothetical protein
VKLSDEFIIGSAFIVCMPQVISVVYRSEKYNQKEVEKKIIKECSFRKLTQPIV